MTARDDVTGGLLATLPLHQELLLRFLTQLPGVLPDFGELVPLRVAVHAGWLYRDLPDEPSLAVLRRLAAATIRTMSDSRLEVLISAQAAAHYQLDRAALQEISANGEQAWQWRGPPEKPANAICSLALILNGRQVITGHVDGVIRRWDTSTGAPAGKPFTRHSAEVCAIAVTPDGEQVVSGDFDGVICRWHAATLEPIGDRPSMQNGPVLETYELYAC